MAVDYSRLEKNIIDVIKEEQIKLGYSRETIRLYYPLESLNLLLKTETDSAGMLALLAEFSYIMTERWGETEVSCRGERFCLCFDPQASEYINDNTPHEGFMYDLVEAARRHTSTAEDLIAVFRKYSDRVHVEKMKDEDFDVLVYFEDGDIDDNLYCLHSEMGHTIYHRYTREDSESLMSGEL